MRGEKPLYYAGPRPENAEPTLIARVPLSAFRIKGNTLQQLYADPHGGDRRYWIDVPWVPANTPDEE
jgi:hypothetical protein